MKYHLGNHRLIASTEDEEAKVRVCRYRTHEGRSAIKIYVNGREEIAVVGSKIEIEMIHA